MSKYSAITFKQICNEYWKTHYNALTANMMSLMSELLKNAKDNEREKICAYIAQNTKFLMIQVNFDNFIHIMNQTKLFDDKVSESTNDTWEYPLTQSDPCLTWSDVSSFDSMLSNTLEIKNEPNTNVLSILPPSITFVNNVPYVHEKQYHLRVDDKVITIPYLDKYRNFPAFIKQVQKEYNIDINGMLCILQRNNKKAFSITQIVYEFLKLDPDLSQQKIDKIIATAIM